MRKVQPEMLRACASATATTSKSLNQEMMALYKKRGGQPGLRLPAGA